MASPVYQTVSHSSGTATSFTATEPTGTVSGDQLLLRVFLDTNPGGWTPPTGWTEKIPAGGSAGGTTVTNGTNTFQAYYYAIERGASAPALNASWTGSNYFEWTITRITGGLTGGSAAFVESITGTTPGAGTTCNSPSATPLTANTLIFSDAWCWAGFSGSEATPTGYSLVQQTAFLGNTQAQKQLTTATAEDPPQWGALGSSTAIWATTVIIASVAAGGPTITGQPTAQQIASGATASFSVTASASGGGSLTYQWKLNGTNVSTGSGGTTANYTTGTLGYSDEGGLYTCAVTETGGTSDGTTTSSSAAVTVGTLVVGANTPVFSASAGTTVAPSYSTLPTIAAGDEIVLIVAQKPSTANGGTVTTPSGYTLQGSLTGAGGYGATLANNTGNTNLFVYTKNSVTGSETGTLTVTVGTNGVCGAVMVLLRPISGSTISYAFASGSDTSAGNVSITCGSDPGETAGDVALQVFNGSSQLILPFSAQAITTTGITYGTVSEVVEYGTTVGNDVAGYVAVAKAQSGTSSAAPVFTATVGGTNTNARGPGVVLRLRAASGTTNGVGSSSIAVTGSGTGASNAASAGTASVAVTGTGAGASNSASSGAPTIALVAAGAGAANVAAAGTAAVTVTGSGVGASNRASAGTASVTVTGSGAGASNAASSATPTVTVAATGTGASVAAAAGSASIALSASGVSSGTVPAAGTASIQVTASGTGAANAASSGTAATQVSTTGTGASNAASAGSAAVLLSATGAGASNRAAAGTAAVQLSGAGTGASNAASSGSPAVTVSCTATGASTAAAAGTASILLSASGVGQSISGGSAGTATIAVSTSATASSIAAAAGTASISLSGAATGTKVVGAAGTATVSLSATGAGTRVLGAAGTASVTLSATGAGASVVGATGTAAVSIAGSGTGAALASSVGAAQITIAATATSGSILPPEPPTITDWRKDTTGPTALAWSKDAAGPTLAGWSKDTSGPKVTEWTKGLAGEGLPLAA